MKKDLDIASSWGYRNSEEIDDGFRFEVNTISGHTGVVIVHVDSMYNKVLFSVKALNLELSVSNVPQKDIIEVIDKLVKGKLSEKECISLSELYKKENYQADLSYFLSLWNKTIIGYRPWKYAGHIKGGIIVNDEEGLVLDFVKKALNYDCLKSIGKIHEITVDNSWPSRHYDLWKRLCSEAAQADKGLLVINVENFNFLKYFWGLKQLAKQEHSDDLKFCGFVLLVINKRIKWKDVIKEGENNYGQFDAMRRFYIEIDSEMFK